MNNNYQKVNTFSRRVQLSQIFTYALIISILTIFFAAIQPNYLSITTKIVMTFFMVLMFSVLLITCFKVSSIDPVDSILLQYRNGDQQKVISEINNCLYCDTCNSYVKKSSKHCKLCDRCVENFDHHCIWVNNCIGLENYYWFFVMIIAAFFYLLFFCISVGLLYQEQNWSNFMPQMIISWIMFGLTMPFCLLLFVLVCFHLNLARKGLTTFEFIMLQRTEDQHMMEIDHIQDEKPEGLNKTQENLANIKKSRNQGNTPSHSQQQPIKAIIFHRGGEESSEESKIQRKKTKNTSSEATKNIEQKTNEKAMKDYFKRHKSMKFLIGQSLIVQNYTQQNYLSTKEKGQQNSMPRQIQRHYRSSNYQQKKINKTSIK